MHRRRGFTLVELLAVVAIIGALAAVIIGALGGAKTASTDTAVKADLATIQTQAILYYGIGNTYCAADAPNCPDTKQGAVSGCARSNTVFDDPGSPVDSVIKAAVADAQEHAKGGASNVICHLWSQEFVVAAQLSTSMWWCVDRTRVAVEQDGPPPADEVDCSY